MCVFHFRKPVEAFSREGGVTISRFSGAFYPREEVGQAGVSWVALGVTLVLPSLLFKLAAQKEKGRRAVAGKSAQQGSKWRLWGAIYGEHRLQQDTLKGWIFY